MKTLNDFPDYAAEAERLAQLGTDMAAAEAERERLYLALNERSSAPHDSIQAKAEALLAGEGEPEENNSLLAEQHEAVVQKASVLRAAVNLQAARVEKLRSQYSEIIAKEAEPEHQKLIKKAITAAADLSKAYGALCEFRDQLEADDFVIGYLPTLPSHINVMGRWDMPGSRIHQLLDEATREGFVNGEYKSRPRERGPYDDLPDMGIESLAAGPDGISRVQVHKGGKLKVLQELYRAEPDQSGWSD